ncbi:uncharacterized protein LOC128989904 [Macrosteles quadrilineatus]|uniref:uncharacterized protein LOC128989904 n=1 Tax=Macrosteles quadrilineatus TaxID=74068 RepID=UPI0023E175F8|nr:uncharacterized protein LOC128989904 [Macrosteles quadrilineatus]
MQPTMDLSQFPLEVLEVLANYLSVQDLSACSAVSIRWREAFNLDLFWRRHCDPLVAGYLQRTTNLVKPRFTEPFSVGSLEPLCPWRIHLMRRAFLFRNWSKGRTTVQNMKFPSPVVNCTLKMDQSGTHWLLVNLGDRTEIWNVEAEPQLHATVGNITAAPSYLDIVGGKLIIVDFYYLVQVFHLKLPLTGFAPSSKFFYTDSESLYVDLANDDDFIAVRDRLRSTFSKGHFLFSADHLLIGYCSYVEDMKENFLHIWNMNFETKYAQENICSALQNKLKTRSCSAYLTSDTNSKMLLCSIYLYDKYITKLVIYSLRSKVFTNFNMTISGKVDWCAISGGLVATSHLLHQLHIYSTHSGNLLNILDTNTRMFFGPNSGLQYQMMDPYLVQPSRESVKIININNHLDSLLLYFYSVYKVITIPPYFVAISARPYLSSNKMIFEVWNVKQKMRMFEHLVAEANCPAFHIIEPLITKTAIAVGKNIRLLSFW